MGWMDTVLAQLEDHLPGVSVGQTAEDLAGAMAVLDSSREFERSGAVAVCPLASMASSDGNQTVAAGDTFAVAGSVDPVSATQPPSDKSAAPRLWARFDVSGTLLLTGVTIRDQAISPSSGSDPLGAAAWVRSGGRLVATGVSFLRLVSTVWGGAVHVDGGGVAEFYGCLFDGCRATNDCSSDGWKHGAGGAISFWSGAAGVIADSALRSSHAGCVGGALYLQSDSQQHPSATNVTISRTTFADNHADYHMGDDVYIWRDNNQGAVPCSPPGEACDAYDGTTRCCFADNDESLTVTLPSN